MKELDNYEIISEALGRVNKELEYAFEYAEACEEKLKLLCNQIRGMEVPDR